MIRANRLTLIAFVALILVSCGKSPEKQAQEFMELGMFDEAKTFLAEKLSKRPKDYELHFLLGKCFLVTGELEKAEESFGRATSLNATISGKIGKMYSDEALSLLKEDEIRKAISFFSNAVNYDSSLKAEIVRISVDSAKVYAVEGYESAARRLFDLAIEYNPQLSGEVAEWSFTTGKSALESGGNYAMLFGLSSNYDSGMKKKITSAILTQLHNRFMDLSSLGRPDFYYLRRLLTRFGPPNDAEINPTYLLADAIARYEATEWKKSKRSEVIMAFKRIYRDFPNTVEATVADQILEAPGKRQIDLQEREIRLARSYFSARGRTGSLSMKPMSIEVTTNDLRFVVSLSSKHRTMEFSPSKFVLSLYDDNGKQHSPIGVTLMGSAGNVTPSISVDADSDKTISILFPMVSPGARKVKLSGKSPPGILPWSLSEVELKDNPLW